MIIAALAVFGIIFGSFINALVWRLHEQDELIGKTTQAAQKRRAQLSISTGRSMCPHCSHELAAKDLVPVLSWLWIRGKCRYCAHPISWQYPIVELITGVFFAVSYIAWPVALHGVWLFQFILWLVFLIGFMALAVYDLHWFLLPDKIVLPLTVLAVIQTIVSAFWIHTLSAFWQPLAAAAIIFGLFWILYQVSGGNWIGAGDVKLAVTLGLLAATPLRAFLVIFLSSLIGTFVSLPLLIKGKQGLKLQIPYGPYLLLATVIVVLFGASLVNWYENTLLF